MPHYLYILRQDCTRNKKSLHYSMAKCSRWQSWLESKPVVDARGELLLVMRDHDERLVRPLAESLYNLPNKLAVAVIEAVKRFVENQQLELTASCRKQSQDRKGSTPAMFSTPLPTAPLPSLHTTSRPTTRNGISRSVPHFDLTKIAVRQ